MQRIWWARGLKPHLVETFHISSEPHFEGELPDVDDADRSPTDKADVLSVGGEGQIRALDRTRPSPPTKQGRAGWRLDLAVKASSEPASRRHVGLSSPDESRAGTNRRVVACPTR